jgi:CheY-like chemotaxis protein
VFENFSRVENFHHKRAEGVGLGLAIVKSVLSKMGGRIWLHSAPGKGTNFIFELPFRAASAAAARHTAAERSEVAAGDELGRMKVLVVDDNEVNRMVLATFLQQMGIEYDEAASGSEALSKINAGRFDTVLLDIQMPDLSGIEVARRVMAMSGNVPSLIAVTAHAFPEEREEIISAGFSEFLVKPITGDDLLQALGVVNGGARSAGELR